MSRDTVTARAIAATGFTCATPWFLVRHGERTQWQRFLFTPVSASFLKVYGPKFAVVYGPKVPEVDNRLGDS